MKASKPYFSHDICTKSDEKIIRLMFDFRKNRKDFSEDILRELVAHAAYGIYWEVIEYLHENSLNADELDMLADELRIDKTILERILNNYELFKIAEGKYISERVLRNLKLQEEKSQKARASANKRHNKNKNGEGAPEENKETPEENKEAPEYDEEFVMSIVQIYNDKFKTTRIVSKANKEKIFKIHTENNLTLEVWEKVFKNAKRGWDIGDKKNVPPNLKKILEEWDSFASDDYFLAPDRDAIARARAEADAQKQREAEAARIEAQKECEERNKMLEQVCNKETAFEFLNKYVLLKNNKVYVAHNSYYKEFSKKYNFTLDELMNFFAAQEGAENG